MCKSMFYSIFILQCLFTIAFCESLKDNNNYPSDSLTKLIFGPLVRNRRQILFDTPLGTSDIDCMQNCPITAEYNPVCGTDGKQYSNPGKLSCSAYCSGSEINIRYYGRCEFLERR